MRGGHHHPWRRLGRLVDWTLHFAHLPDGILGHTDFRRRTITLAHGLTQAERRSTLEHELHHVDRGPAPQWRREYEERVVDDLAARRLIAFDDLLEAMVWSYDEHEVAEELWVDVGMVRARMRGLTDEESVELERRLYDRERSA
jgi:hypothetical protein